MYNKSRTHQSNKIEKENQNINLRKNIKSLSTDIHMINKKETVWDRLSKLKKVSSSENVLRVARSRSNLTGKSLQRFQTSFKQSIPPTRKPLTPLAPISKIPSLSQKICKKKQNVLPEYDNQTFSPASPVKENLSPLGLSKRSKSISDTKVAFDTLSTTLNECIHSIDHRESSDDSNEEYILAPLMTSYVEQGSHIPMRTGNSVCDFLKPKSKTMIFKDVELVRDVINSDTRCENLENNPKVLKDILKARLQNILMHEFAVKKALDNLESSVSLQQSLEIKSIESTNKIVNYLGHNKETQKFEVDVIFKNVPSLDKEIEILRALGEKLEATLKTTTSHIGRSNTVSQISIVSDTNQLLVVEKNNRRTMFKLKYEIYYISAENNAQISVPLIGIRYCLGAVNEFCMAQKSIVELKRESNRPFYIPSNSESVKLVRTSFKKLKETPDELLRQLKPKNSQIAFNVLEQDPIFFYSAFNKQSNLANIFSTNYDQYEKYHLPIKETLFDGENGHFWNTTIEKSPPSNEHFLVDRKEPGNIHLFNFKSESGEGGNNKLFNTRTMLESLIRGKRRRRIRRRVTPMPITNYYCPKNSLFKTVLVGFVQMSVFIVFIMALTYPDLRC